MYPAPFRYHRPASIADAITLLSELGDGARPLAGGQTLIPILKLRMDEPSDLVDIARIPGLRHIENDRGTIRIGALATHGQIGQSALAQQFPILADCGNGIADMQVRARGTIGGSISAADPSCDWPSLLHVLDAELICHGPDGERAIAIQDFIQGAYTTALGAAELLTEIRFPAPLGRQGGAYVGFKKAAPAYPSAAVGVQLSLGAGDICERIRIVLSAVAPRPVTSVEAEEMLRGKALSEDGLHAAAEIIIAQSDPPADSRGTPEFKRAILRKLFMKAAKTALNRAGGTQIDGSHNYV